MARKRRREIYHKPRHVHCLPTMSDHCGGVDGWPICVSEKGVESDEGAPAC
jgi:hypothetical protein